MGTSQRKQTERKQTHTSVRRTCSFRPCLTLCLIKFEMDSGCLMSNRFCYIWPSTTDHGTSVIDRIPLKSSTMASQSVSGWPWRQLWLFWRPRPLNSACADGLTLGSTNLTSDYPAIKSDPRSIAILIWYALVKQKLVDQIGWPRILIQIKLDLDWWNAPWVTDWLTDWLTDWKVTHLWSVYYERWAKSD